VIVTVEILPWLSELISGSISQKEMLEEEIPLHATLRTLLDLLVDRHSVFGRMVYDPEGRRLTGHAELAVNGTLYDAVGGLDLTLHHSDTITFLPGIAGGLV